MSQKIVVVGAGHAAGEFCAALVQGGYGGSVTLFGDEPHLPYQRPPLSKAYLTGDMARERLYLRDADFYADNRIEVRPNEPVVALNRADKTVTVGDAVTHPYDALVLMTGARVRTLTCPGSSLEGVRYVRSIADADDLGQVMKPSQRLAVIGGGYIGLEVAATARKRGLEVTVLEMAPRLLARVASEAFSADVQRIHEAQGVDVRCNTGVRAILGDTSVSGVALETGEELDADHVVVGIGVLANEELAAASGLKTDNGIIVDGRGRTNDPDIYAAGDVARFEHKLYGSIRLESVQNAVEQANVCAEAILGQDVSYDPVPWFWSDQFDAKIQLAGLSTGHDATVRREGKRPGSHSIWLYREGRLVAVEALSDAPAYMMGKRWLEEGKTPPPERIANAEIKIREVV